MTRLKPLAMVNGEFSNSIDVRDRGLHYGDGLFETILVERDCLLLWQRHLSRLIEGCQRLHIDPPDPHLLRRESDLLLSRWNDDRAVLKIIVTRGMGGRGYSLRGSVAPHRLLSIHPAPAYPSKWYREGVAARFCDIRLSAQPLLAGMKHLNRLEQVLARSEWNDEYAEGLMCDERGNVVEGVMSNLFVLSQDTLATPLLDQCGVAGVTRATILERAHALIDNVTEKKISTQEVLAADALFLTNSVIGVWQIASLEDKVWQLHPLAQRLRALIAHD